MSNPQPSAHPSTQNSAQRSVLITGASGGVGDAATRTLAGRGYRVLAGVRNPAGYRAPAPGVIPVALDVTDPGSVAADALLGALEAARPKARYTVGPDTRPIGLPARLPPRTRDRLLTRVLGLNKVKPAVPGAVPAPVAEQAATPASRA